MTTQSLEGRSTRFEKTVARGDVLEFARLSGDDHPIHVDDAFARDAGLSGGILQGSLLVGLMAGASTKFFGEIGRPALSYGYDRIRFIGQVEIGASVAVDYTISKHDQSSGKTWAEVKAVDADRRLVAVAVHVAKLL